MIVGGRIGYNFWSKVYIGKHRENLFKKQIHVLVNQKSCNLCGNTVANVDSSCSNRDPKSREGPQWGGGVDFYMKKYRTNSFNKSSFKNSIRQKFVTDMKFSRIYTSFQLVG